MNRARAISVARSVARRALTPRQLDALRRARARLRGLDSPAIPVESGPGAGVSRSQEVLALAQRQRDEAREQLRDARRQRDEARQQLQQLREQRNEAGVAGDQTPAERRQLRSLVIWARNQREIARWRVVDMRAEHGRTQDVVKTAQQQRDLAREELREARRQRDRAAAQRTTVREQRDRLRLELDAMANPDLAAWTQFERLRRHRPWRQSDVEHTEPRVMGYGPVGTQNPVLSLLYARCLEHGVAPVPIRRVDPGQRPQIPPGSVFNLHWTRFVQLGCETAAQAGDRSDELLRTLRGLRESGVHLVWTIHEELPHDCPFPEIEIKLRSELCELASLVHVLHGSTAEVVKPYYELDPAKVLVVEHPLYTGMYPDFVTRGTARASLELEDDDFTILVFGTIRPYKGIDRLLAAVRDVRGRELDRRVRVVIAGPKFDSVDCSQLLLRARATPGVTIEPRAIHTQHVQHLFRAADLVVLPYTEFLNSGVLLLALTFGRPVLAPENPVTRDMVASGLVRLFGQTAHDRLAVELRQALTDPEWLPTGPIDPDFARRHDPIVLSERFARAVAALPETVV